jgi:acyl-CoA thioesterase I
MKQLRILAKMAGLNPPYGKYFSNEFSRFIVCCLLFISGYSYFKLQFSSTPTDLTPMTLFSRFTTLMARATAAAVLMTVAGAGLSATRATAQQTPQKTILVLGDSISAAYGLSPSQGWVALLGQRVAAKAPQYTVKNASSSGDTTAGGAQRLPALLKQHTPAIVLIELGGNDALRGLPLAQTQANFTTMILAAKAAKAQVLLVPMQIPPNYGAAYGTGFNGLYAKLGKTHRVNTSEFILKDFAQDLSQFQRDRIHPSAAAQPKMLDAVWPALQGLLQ